MPLVFTHNAPKWIKRERTMDGFDPRAFEEVGSVSSSLRGQDHSGAR